MTKKSLPKWDADRTASLVDMVGTDYTVEVTVDQVNEIADALDTTTRSVASKLRKLGYSVESTASVKKKSFTEEQEKEIADLLNAHPGMYTYAELAQLVLGSDEFSRKVQGKVLAMEMTDKIKKAEVKEIPKKYNEEEEALIVKMVNEGAFLEDIAEALGRDAKSIRGKTLSMIKSHGITIPKQKESHAKEKGDPLEALGDVSEMTVEAIAESIGKTVRGVKTMLTIRGITCSDYDGAAKAKKNAEKKAKAEAA